MLEIPEVYLQKINQQKRTQYRIRQIITALSLLVALGVSWGLKLTGITMAGEAFCGYDEHVHCEECYEKSLVCTQEEAEPHIHEESCLRRSFVCTLPEEPHFHTEQCYEETYTCDQEAEPEHVHDDSCLQDILICEEEECGGHHHDAWCFEEVIGCGLDETEGHYHGDECMEGVLTCDLEENDEHTHDDACYIWEIICGCEEQEPHFHDESCMVTALVCDLEECGLHMHDESCYGWEISCGQEESETHAHTDDCMCEVLQCTEPVCTEHFHTEECYALQICCDLEETEGHAHTDACTVTENVCGLEETDGHNHSDACWEYGIGFGCGCMEADGHIHSEACLTEETELDCGLEATQGHIHTDSCYEYHLICQTEEHIHTESCYSDFNADLETSGDWEQMASGLTGIPGTPERLIQIAQSQLGYTESIRNYQVDEDGVRRGITRYGQWYGNAYGDWSTMFTCFCLDYAGFTRVPYNAGADALRREWDVAGMYVAAAEGNPEKGNILFLDMNENGIPDTTAIITSVQPDSLVVIQGDLPGYEICIPDASEIPEAEELAVSEEIPEETVEEVVEEASEEIAEEVIEEATEEIIEEIAEEATEEIIEEVVEEAVEEVTEEVAEELAEEAIIWEESEEITASAEEDTAPMTCHVVAETQYSRDDSRIVGYGVMPEKLLVIMKAARAAARTTLAKTVDYSSSIFSDTARQFVVYTRGSDGNDYAFDGNGNAVRIYIDDEGVITSDIADPNLILWTFTSTGNDTYRIRNVSTGKYMHSHSGGVTTTGNWTSQLVAQSGGGVKVKSNNDYAGLNISSGAFERVSEGNASVYQFGYTQDCTVWLDGTDGGLMSLTGSPNTSYTMRMGTTFTLPEQWQSPGKYSYTLRGWYDVINHRYYAPGTEITVMDNMVFYADWVASSYDIGQFNSQVTDTVSTNEFITVRMFDYGPLFNVLSSSSQVTVSGSAHSETWSLITNGNNPYNGEPTLDFIFRDWDQGSKDITYPANTNTHNNYDASVDVHQGLYNPRLDEILFGTDNSFDPETGSGVLGKQYLGTADYLFQLMTDPNDPHYGYYYYDSELHAASYNQSDQRFYVYDYLERTADSAGASDSGKYSDFLPLNSPYTNTNGNNPATYTYSGNNGEYAGVTHYTYEATDGTRSPVGTNYLFGMNIEIEFFLPNAPGSGGNKDFYGKDMHFKFSGDDDVWILVDDKLVLDLGGIHGIESGDINFSTGVVTVNGVKNDALSNALCSIEPGDHTFHILYLERGSSQSNCAMYFNLAPQYSFQIQKEDVLTRDVLNGAQFSVFMDQDCKVPAVLWRNKAAYDADEPSTNSFTVENGVADMWGMAAGQTYYIKETRAPDAEGYGIPHGIIELNYDMQGFINYQVHVVEDNGNLTPGFTVHGIKVDEESQSAFIVATNVPDVPGQEPTSVTVHKVWDDNQDHSGDSVTVYLTVTDPDGTVRRVREIVLSERIGWTYTWENLPKLDAQGNEVVYGVQEATVPGYVGRVEEVDPSDTGGSSPGGATTAGEFENGQTYLLSTRFGYLGTANNKLLLEQSQETAANTAPTQWVATVNSDGTVTLVNKAGQTFYYDNYTFRASSSPGNHKNLHYSDNLLSCHIDHGSWQDRQYPVDNANVPSNITYNGVLYTTNNSAEALAITPMKLGGSTPEPPEPVEGSGNFRITNTPAGKLITSLSVEKIWNTGALHDPSLYETLTVEMKLLANGKDSGLAAVLSLKNQWKHTFTDLPMYDSDGNLIDYRVEETPISDKWMVEYGEIVSLGTSPPAYSTTVTNTYVTGGPELPSTGTSARLMYVLCGGSMMLTSLVYGILLRRKRERRMK